LWYDGDDPEWFGRQEDTMGAVEARVIQAVCVKTDLDAQGNDLAYWQAQPYQARLMALEEIRQEYHHWRYGAEPRLQSLYNR
jgi:hypothetical protein